MIFRSKTGSSFFEDRYKKKEDPWNFAQSEYEQGRFAKIAGALSHKRYRRAFEPGCSIGTLTERLAAISDEVYACDFSQTASSRAKERCAAMPHVHVSCAALTEDTPLAGYDLIVFSEIGYYFRSGKWPGMVSRYAKQMEPGTTLLASHWLGETKDHRQSADEVHNILRSEPLLALEHEERNPGFRLDRFVRR